MDFFYLKIQIATSLATNECHPQHKWSMYLRLTNLIITDKELNTHKKIKIEKINSEGDFK